MTFASGEESKMTLFDELHKLNSKPAAQWTESETKQRPELLALLLGLLESAGATKIDHWYFPGDHQCNRGAVGKLTHERCRLTAADCAEINSGAFECDRPVTPRKTENNDDR